MTAAEETTPNTDIPTQGLHRESGPVSGRENCMALTAWVCFYSSSSSHYWNILLPRYAEERALRLVYELNLLRVSSMVHKEASIP